MFSLENRLKENISIFELSRAVSGSRNESYSELHTVEGNCHLKLGRQLLMGMMIDFPTVAGWDQLHASSSVGASVRDILQRGVSHQMENWSPLILWHDAIRDLSSVVTQLIF